MNKLKKIINISYFVLICLYVIAYLIIEFLRFFPFSEVQWFYITRKIILLIGLILSIPIIVIFLFFVIKKLLNR